MTLKEKIGLFLDKHGEFIRYLIVGVMTTAINFAVFYFLNFIDDTDSEIITILHNSTAWSASVVFSYYASRRFVFKSSAESTKQRLGEFTGFALSRAFTLVLEDVLLFVLVKMDVDSKIAKLMTSVIVVIVNYITGHLVFHGLKRTWRHFKEFFSSDGEDDK